MLYPTCFRIYLHPTDFNGRKDAFNVIARNLADDFNEFNRAKLHEYQDNKPHATHWLFQFVKLSEDSAIGDADCVEMGDVYIISTLYSQDFSKGENNVNIGEVRGVTLTKQNKRSANPQQRNNVNEKAFFDVDMLDANRYRINITEGYGRVTITPNSDAQTQTQLPEGEILAHLVCDKNFISGNKAGNKYNITTSQVEISGKNDTRSGAQWIKVDSDTLPDSIVHIKYENNKFWLAVFGKVRLNGMLVKESKGGDLHWELLSDKARMMINDEVAIEFVSQLTK